MSETPKRRRGDRRDAVLLRETDALHFIMGIIYPHRADNEAYIAERIDLEPIKAYLAKKNVEGIEFKYTFFHVIVAALVKTITLRPKLNRFYANENYYQRNKVTAGFVIKKEFSDGSEEAVALLDAAPTDTVDTVHEEIRRRVYATRHEQKLNTTDNSMDILNKLPRFLSKAAIRFIRWLDRHGWCPDFLVGEDPNYASVFLSNLGSIRLRGGYHHASSAKISGRRFTIRTASSPCARRSTSASRSTSALPTAITIPRASGSSSTCSRTPSCSSCHLNRSRA